MIESMGYPVIIRSLASRLRVAENTMIQFILATTLVATLFFSTAPGLAQHKPVPEPLAETTKSATAADLPEPLTRQAIRDVLSGLDDAQVRDLLLNELDKKAAAREAQLGASDQRSFGEELMDLGSELGQSWTTIFAAMPRIPHVAANTFARYQAMRGDASPWRILGSLLLGVLAGIAAAFLVSKLMRKQEVRLDELRPSNLWMRIGTISAQFLVQGLRLIAFLIAAYAMNALVNRAIPPDSSVVRVAIGAIGWTWLAVMIASFVLSPARPSLRLCPVDDRTARFLTRRTGLVFGWSAFSIGLLALMRQFGWPLDEVRPFWLGVILYGLITVTIWQARRELTQMILGQGEVGWVWNRFAQFWPMIAIGLVAFQWLILELLVATDGIQGVSMTAMNGSLGIVLALPLFELMIRSLVVAIWPGDPEQEPALQAAHKQTQAGIVRCGRIITVALVIVVLTSLWGLDLRDLASQGVGGRLAGVMTEVFLIAVVAYGLWELLNIVADRQTAIEQVTLGIDPDDEGHSDAEVGTGGTRLGTLMPLLRRVGQVVILALTLLAILGQLGVNVLPLLAGAGIAGLAIGFGAQTLVKDIISGIFFLVDDAFRKGEYIDIGEVKGTVEKISIRSMQLRHHNGPLNTVPFGEIRHLTNYSRDWVIMKLPLRVTYDTDVERLRKLIKKLGLELMEDPELGPKFLEPLKSQGVIEMDDSAMIVRVKFMTRPGDQFGIRNKVFTQIREMFEREGMHFAHSEVTVHIADRDPKQPLSEAQKEAAAAAARSVVEARAG